MKTAFVTGGSRGIGLAVAKELGKSGFSVALMATKEESNYPESTRPVSYTHQMCIRDRYPGATWHPWVSTYSPGLYFGMP